MQRGNHGTLLDVSQNMLSDYLAKNEMKTYARLSEHNDGEHHCRGSPFMLREDYRTSAPGSSAAYFNGVASATWFQLGEYNLVIH